MQNALLRKGIVFASVSIVLLLISSATAVPYTQSKPIKKITSNSKWNTLSQKIIQKSQSIYNNFKKLNGELTKYRYSLLNKSDLSIVHNKIKDIIENKLFSQFSKKDSLSTIFSNLTKNLRLLILAIIYIMLSLFCLLSWYILSLFSPSEEIQDIFAVLLGVLIAFPLLIGFLIYEPKFLIAPIIIPILLIILFTKEFMGDILEFGFTQGLLIFFKTTLPELIKNVDLIFTILLFFYFLAILIYGDAIIHIVKDTYKLIFPNDDTTYIQGIADISTVIKSRLKNIQLIVLRGE